MAYGVFGLLIVGGIVTLVGYVMFLVAAFRASVAWGLGVLLLAPVSLAFLIMNWQESKKAFFIQLAGLAALVAGILLSGQMPQVH